VDAPCQSYLKGRVLVSMGLLTQMTINERFGVGDLATGLGDELRVNVTVLGPSWVTADRVDLFANGVKIREMKIDATQSIEKARVAWTIPRPAHDIHLVAIATGPGVTLPCWAIPRPYQPTSRVWEPRVIGATNPVWIDADGDGRFTSPRGYAAGLVSRAGPDPAKLIPLLDSFDQAVATQVASLCHAAGRDGRNAEWKRLLKSAPGHIRDGFEAFLKSTAAP